MADPIDRSRAMPARRPFHLPAAMAGSIAETLLQKDFGYVSENRRGAWIRCPNTGLCKFFVGIGGFTYHVSRPLDL